MSFKNEETFEPCGDPILDMIREKEFERDKEARAAAKIKRDTDRALQAERAKDAARVNRLGSADAAGAWVREQERLAKAREATEKERARIQKILDESY